MVLSCNNQQTVINEFKDLNNSKWSYLDTLNFDVSIGDTLNNFDVFLQLKHLQIINGQICIYILK